MPLGLMGAMPEEIDAVLRLVSDQRIHERAGRSFVHGRLHGVPVVVVFSRWGKVAAASTATELIVAHDVDRIVFTGVAGSLNSDVSLGDVVIASELIHHDLDASPFFPPRVIPLIGIERVPTDDAMSLHLMKAAQAFLCEDAPRLWPTLASQPSSGASVHRGIVATGDQVIASADRRCLVAKSVPDALCVEMEGAAVGQVCMEHAIPFACVRTISDAADESAEHCFENFISTLASAYSAGIIDRWLRDP